MQCAVCDEAFQTDKQLQEHEKRHEARKPPEIAEAEDTSVLFYCEECDYTATKRRSVSTHTFRAHRFKSASKGKANQKEGSKHEEEVDTATVDQVSFLNESKRQ